MVRHVFETRAGNQQTCVWRSRSFACCGERSASHTTGMFRTPTVPVTPGRPPWTAFRGTTEVRARGMQQCPNAGPSLQSFTGPSIFVGRAHTSPLAVAM